MKMVRMRVLFYALLLFFFFPCAKDCEALPCRVVVVENTASLDSVRIVEFYALRRHIPPANICRITCATTEECSSGDGKATIIDPVLKWIARHHLQVDYIVLTKGIPIRFNWGEWYGCSIDSILAGSSESLPVKTLNPYFAATDRFTHKEYGIYLVTRLTGWTLADCFSLIDSGSAKSPGRGPIYLHPATDKDGSGYFDVNQSIRNAAADLHTAGFNVDIDQSFHTTNLPLAGYYSWGSNDPEFDKTMYSSLVFSPGALAETAVSTSGRTFDNPYAPGQSLIADLIHDGVAGCKGYVSEPYADAIALAEIMFDDYTQGWDLADSLYAASRYICWKDIVIGDPLCDPYARQHK
jgi:uncharacterized protein (TIGR03790 family)